MRRQNKPKAFCCIFLFFFIGFCHDVPRPNCYDWILHFRRRTIPKAPLMNDMVEKCYHDHMITNSPFCYACIQLCNWFKNKTRSSPTKNVLDYVTEPYDLCLGSDDILWLLCDWPILSHYQSATGHIPRLNVYFQLRCRYTHITQRTPVRPAEWNRSSSPTCLSVNPL